MKWVSTLGHILELEVTTLEEHGPTLPLETEPLRGLDRNDQLGWRQRDLSGVGSRRARLELLRWMRRALTLRGGGGRPLVLSPIVSAASTPLGMVANPNRLDCRLKALLNNIHKLSHGWIPESLPSKKQLSFSTPSEQTVLPKIALLTLVDDPK